ENAFLDDPTDPNSVNRFSRSPYTVTAQTNFYEIRSQSHSRSLPDMASMWAAYTRGHDHRSVGSGSNELRIYSVRMMRGDTIAGILQVARSTSPEQDSLSKLFGGLLLCGAAGLVLAALGGWFLAGRSLAPVKAAFEHQKEFVADASHELRTPLAVIRANAEYLTMEQPDNVELREILRETDRLSSLVDSLLALARDQDAEAPMQLVDLGHEVQDAVASLQHLAEDRGVTLTVSTAEGLLVKGHAEQLRQLVVILVDNALRYTPAGGHVHVQVAPDGGSALITVHDDGMGIPEQALGHVFERFYRADEARTRESGGTGLGLAIAQELVKQHGGRIEVDSTVDIGTTFVVRIPLARTQAREPSAAVEA
ncbi:MAG TPA: HAMP domain-containing sensor histidine kinase, partial [Gaiellales bacterium]|nr:HAMP domain-containing sensor histidine kinase [Gaiellales bacterium]